MLNNLTKLYGGTAEANEVSDTDNPKDIPNIQSIEDDQPPEQPDSCATLEQSGPEVSQDTDWPEHFSQLQSPAMVLQTIYGRNFDYNMLSQAGLRGLCTSPHSNNSAVKVEELTLENYRSPNLSFDGSSSSGAPLSRTQLWPSFTKLAGKSTEKVPKECLALSHKTAKDRGGYVSSVGSQRSFPCLHWESKASKISEQVSGGENRTHLSDLHARCPSTCMLQSQVSSASGFHQFFMRNSLKGKGVAFKSEENYYAASPAQTIERPNTYRKLASNLSHVVRGKSDSVCLLGGGGVVGSGHEGIVLREWLKPRRQRINKVQRMLLFKQILDLVDDCHSQGLALQHLRPSYFLVLPLNQVKYLGSFIRQGQTKMSTSLVQDVHRPEHILKRTLYMEEDAGAHEMLKKKHQKFSDGNSITYPEKADYRKKDQVEENEDDTFVHSGSDFRTWNIPHKIGGISLGTTSQQSVSELVKLEEGWYASPEELGDHVFSFPSNIYSLGVLFFELFCHSETWEVHCAAMSDIRHRILPPNFLSENPKEAGFCLWLLHPEPCSRPSSRDIVSSDLVKDRNLSTIDHSPALNEEEDAETDLLLHFLLSLKEKKEKQAVDLVANMKTIGTDLGKIERRYLSRADLFSNGIEMSTNYTPLPVFHSRGKPIAHTEVMAELNSSSLYTERFLKNFEQLENAYFSMRTRFETSGSNSVIRSDAEVLKMRERSFRVQNNTDNLEELDDQGIFFEGLCKFARYTKFEVCSNIKNIDILNCANVICSLSFDCDEDYFAAAGVSKKIKIFEFSSILNDTVDIHYPLLEMSSRSKLSCVCWNSYVKNYLASTDYEGVVQLWDASTGQGFMQFTEHQKRSWSVHFSQVDPIRLASGSDDFSVKLWSIHEKKCTDTIRNMANVCCVQFSPYSSYMLSFGSANYRIYCYDLRNTRMPWCTLAGHEKAISYVKFLDSKTLVSASTDNTLKIWDLKTTNASGLSDMVCSLTLRGHTNEKNFVGLSVHDGYITCGSETNEVYGYYRTFPMPMTSHKFGSIDPITAHETTDDGGQFVSSVCWRGKSNMVVAANSTGSIKVLKLV